MSVETKIQEKVITDITPPKMWKVILLNDDKTPMEFVIDLLSTLFKHSQEKAKEITLEIHNTGSGVAGVYAFEIAEQKGVEATNLARSNSFPLQVHLEAE